MPDPVDIYARLRFQQGTVAADARAAMEAARKEFAQGIEVPLRFQQQGGVGAGGGVGAATGITANAGGGKAGNLSQLLTDTEISKVAKTLGLSAETVKAASLMSAKDLEANFNKYADRKTQIWKSGGTSGQIWDEKLDSLTGLYRNLSERRLAEQRQMKSGGGMPPTAEVTQAATAAAKAATPATATVITQAATAAATKAATQAAGGGAGGGAGAGASPITPAAQGAAQSLNQLTQGIRAVTRIAAVAEGVAAVGELGIHGGRLASALAGGKNLTAAREVEAMQQTVRAIPLIGNIADRIGGTVYDLISSAKNYAGGGRFESDQSYAARLSEEQRFQDKITQLRAQRARAFLPGPQAAVQAAEDQRSEFAQSREAQLLKEQNPDLYRRVYEEIGRTINVVKKKAAIEEEHDDFQHQQTLTKINDQAEVARMEASGNRLGAERKQLSDHFDQEIAAAQEAAKEYREVNRDKDAQEAEDEAKSLAGLKAARLAEFDAQNRIIGFHTGMDLWQRMAEAAARYTETVKGTGDATVAAASKAQGAAKPAAAAAATDYGAQAENIRSVLEKQGAELPEEFTDRAGLLTAARNYDALRKQATDPKEKTRYATIAATIRHLIQVNAAARLGHQVGATPGGMPRGTEEFETGFTEEAQQAEEQGGTPEFLGAQQQRAMEARMRLNQKRKPPAVALDQGGDFAALAGTTAAPSAEDLTPTLASGGVRDIALADGSFDKFKRAMKEAMRETGAQFELIK